MNRFFLFTMMFLFSAVVLFGQEKYKQGLAAMQKRQYQQAISYFNQQKRDPNVSAKTIKDCQTQIAECERQIKLKAQREQEQREQARREQEAIEAKQRRVVNEQGVLYVYFPNGKSDLWADQKRDIKSYVETIGALHKDFILEIITIQNSAMGKAGERLARQRTDAVLDVIKSCGNYRIDEKNLGGTEENDEKDIVTIIAYWPSSKQEANREESSKRELEEYAKKGYMNITGVSFANTTYDGTIITNYGNTLDEAELRYLKPKMNYVGLSSKPVKIELYFKIYDSSGKLLSGASSPSGYTWKEEVTVSQGSRDYSLSGWGNKNGGTYSAGLYGFEIWYNGNLLYSTQVNIKGRPLSIGNWRKVMSSAVKNNSTEVHNNNDVYKGQMKDGQRSGLGVYCWDVGQFYWGNWKDGKRNGLGIYIADRGYQFGKCSDCVYYVGSFSNGKAFGKGTCYDVYGNLIYYGNLEESSPTETYPSSGNMSDYKFECIEYSSGSYYIGETKKGQRHGIGIFLWSNGDAWYGQWKDGERNGSGILLYHDGSLLGGNWVGDTRTN